MDKFLQQFKENLENQPPPSFDQQDWENMQKRLHDPPSSVRPVWPYWAWLFAILFVCSLGFNWFIYNQYKKVAKDITILQQGKDTVFHTTVVYRTDTVYQNYPLEKAGNTIANTNLLPALLAPPRSTRYAAKTNPILYQSKGSPVSPWYSSGLSHQLIQGNAPTYSSPFSFSMNGQTTSSTQEDAAATTLLSLGLVSPLASLSLSNVVSLRNPSPNLSSPEMTEQKKSLRQILYPFRPKGIAIGASIGGGTTFSNNYNDLHSFNRELVGKIKFSDALRLSLDLGLSTIGYEAGEMGNQYGVPVIAFPNDDYELQEIRVNREIWSATIGMEYSFLVQKKWQPFVGIGFGASSLTKNKVNYVFEDEMTDEYVTEERTYEKASSLQYTRFDVGIAYKIGNKWSIQLAMDYIYRLQKFNNQLPNNANIGLRGLYSF